MTLWMIEPHDSLIFRDSRPFHALPGAKASTLPFPFPSTLAGAARTQAGLNEQGMFWISGDRQLEELKHLAVRGPFLVQLTRDSTDIERWLLPAPLDALAFAPKGSDAPLILSRLLPLRRRDEAITDFDRPSSFADAGASEAALPPPYLVGQARYNPAKPASKAPIYWYDKNFMSWLLNEDDPHKPQEMWKEIESAQLGIGRLLQDTRIHIQMDAHRSTAAEGALFETVGLEFLIDTKHSDSEPALSAVKRLALVVDVDEDYLKNHPIGGRLLSMYEGASYLGGERRIVNWQRMEQETQLPCCSEKFKEQIIAHIRTHNACRLILLTPGYFERGYQPQWFIKHAREQYGLQIELAAIAIQRPVVVSGWDMQSRKPKKSRRLAPAGTVLFLNFAEHAADKTEKWVRDMWLHSISEDEQDRYDGGGLAIFGKWSGEPVEQQLKQEIAS
jgi:CRISPR-associated protein Cmr3